ncbi:MAG: tetratricopeptide repeat protein [bacterium]
MASTARIDELKKKFDENPRRYFAPLANEFRKAGDIEQAIMICEEFLPQQPGHMSGHIVYGQALYEAGRMPESRTVFETALGLDPENLIALRHLGDIAHNQGDAASARTWYMRVLDADPRNEEIQALIAAIPAGHQALNEPDIIADDDFDLSAPTEPMARYAPVEAPMEIEKEETTLMHGNRDLAATDPFGVPAVSSPPVPPPLPSTELIDGFSLAGFGVPVGRVEAPSNHDASEGLEGLESTSFEAPAESIANVHDLDDSLESGVPSFDAPTQAIAAVDGLQGSGGHEFSDDDADNIVAEKLELDHGMVLSPHGDASAPPRAESTGFVSETPWSEREREREEATAPYDARADDAMPIELPPEVIAAEADLIDAGESPEPEQSAEMEEVAYEAEEAYAAPPPFVTETMAELYLAQGFRDEARAVYLQLSAASPHDERLQGLVASLAPHEEPARDAEPTVRDFFARMAARRPGMRDVAAAPPSDDDFADSGAYTEPAAAPLEPHWASEAPAAESEAAIVGTDWNLVEPEAPQAVTTVPEEPAARPERSNNLADVAPALERVAAMRTPTGSIDALFGHRNPGTSEDSAASALAQAFGATAEAEPLIVGRPARAATGELSLDSVFRDGPARPPRTSQSFSFDQFFASGAKSGGTDRSSGTPTPGSSTEVQTSGDAPGERGPDDIEQFNSWLQGLKPR